MLIMFICVGRWLEHIVKHKASSALGDLLAMQAPDARLCRTGTGTGTDSNRRARANGSSHNDLNGGSKLERLNAPNTGEQRTASTPTGGGSQSGDSSKVGREANGVAPGAVEETSDFRIVEELAIDVDLLQRDDIIRVLPGVHTLKRSLCLNGSLNLYFIACILY